MENQSAIDLLWSLVKASATGAPIATGLYLALVKHSKMLSTSFTDIIHAAVKRRDDWHDIRARVDAVEQRQHEDGETLKRIDERIDEIYKLLIKTR